MFFSINTRHIYMIYLLNQYNNGFVMKVMII